MLRYICKRLLVAIPVLLLLSLALFFLSKAVPGDQVANLISSQDIDWEERNPESVRKDYFQKMQMLGYDEPLFYFSVLPKNYPDTLHKIYPIIEKDLSRSLIKEYMDWPSIQEYRNRLQRFEKEIYITKDSLSKAALLKLRPQFLQLQLTSKRGVIQQHLDSIEQIISPHASLTSLNESFRKLKQAAGNMLKADVSNSLMPSFHWHGLKNQYHNWFSNFVKGDFGVSLIDQQSSRKKILSALRWTLILNLSALLFMYLVSIPLGWSFASRAGSSYDKWGSVLLYMFYAIPAFWLATLFLIFLTTPEYGRWTDLFPSYGLGRYLGQGFSIKGFINILWHLVLPVLSLGLGSLAFVSRQMRTSTLHELKSDYMRTALAKGLTEKEAMRKHAARNSLFPIVTMLAGLLPALIGGSLVIEVIFSIPGMGKLTYNSILANDWPVLFAVLLLIALMTIIGYLLADILYARLDPRVKFQNERGR